VTEQPESQPPRDEPEDDTGEDEFPPIARAAWTAIQKLDLSLRRN
jgi:hypothetical protein